MPIKPKTTKSAPKPKTTKSAPKPKTTKSAPKPKTTKSAPKPTKSTAKPKTKSDTDTKSKTTKSAPKSTTKSKTKSDTDTKPKTTKSAPKPTKSAPKPTKSAPKPKTTRKSTRPKITNSSNKNMRMKGGKIDHNDWSKGQWETVLNDIDNEFRFCEFDYTKQLLKPIKKNISLLIDKYSNKDESDDIIILLRKIYQETDKQVGEIIFNYMQLMNTEIRNNMDTLQYKQDIPDYIKELCPRYFSSIVGYMIISSGIYSNHNELILKVTGNLEKKSKLLRYIVDRYKNLWAFMGSISLYKINGKGWKLDMESFNEIIEIDNEIENILEKELTEDLTEELTEELTKESKKITEFKKTFNEIYSEVKSYTQLFQKKIEEIKKEIIEKEEAYIKEEEEKKRQEEEKKRQEAERKAQEREALNRRLAGIEEKRDELLENVAKGHKKEEEEEKKNWKKNWRRNKILNTWDKLEEARKNP